MGAGYQIVDRNIGLYGSLIHHCSDRFFRSLAVSIKAGDDALHEKINRTRESARETKKRLDQVLAALAQYENKTAA